MAFFKKAARKVVADVKEVAKQEVKETGKSVMSQIIPVAIAFGVGLALGILLRKPSLPVSVVVVK